MIKLQMSDSKKWCRLPAEPWGLEFGSLYRCCLARAYTQV